MILKIFLIDLEILILEFIEPFEDKLSSKLFSTLFVELVKFLSWENVMFSKGIFNFTVLFISILPSRSNFKKPGWNLFNNSNCLFLSLNKEFSAFNKNG